MKLLALLALPLAACAGLASAPGSSATVDPTFDTSTTSTTIDPAPTPDPDPTPPPSFDAPSPASAAPFAAPLGAAHT